LCLFRPGIENSRTKYQHKKKNDNLINCYRKDVSNNLRKQRLFIHRHRSLVLCTPDQTSNVVPADETTGYPWESFKRGGSKKDNTTVSFSFLDQIDTHSAHNIKKNVVLSLSEETQKSKQFIKDENKKAKNAKPTMKYSFLPVVINTKHNTWMKK